MPFLVYLHGYNSSPSSFKVQQTEQWLKDHAPEIAFHCPALSPFPLKAIEQIHHIIAAQNQTLLGFVGSSMGGFYATWLAEHYQAKAVLINPAVNPHLLVPKYLGENANYHTGETFVLEPHHVDDFKSLELESIKNPENLLVLLQTGDEVLDYRHAEEKYGHSRLVIEEGGDHSFQNYQQHLPNILKFLTA